MNTHKQIVTFYVAECKPNLCWFLCMCWVPCIAQTKSFEITVCSSTPTPQK